MNIPKPKTSKPELDIGGKVVVAVLTTSMLLVIGIVAMFLSTYFSGYVLSSLWEWFVVPVFALPQLGIWHAAGLILVGKFATNVPLMKDFRPTEDDKDRSTSTRITEATVLAFLYPFLFLTLGWTIKYFFIVG
jgi:ABC-type dipeptide/oligopeptide/nickel transport system permease subunit